MDERHTIDAIAVSLAAGVGSRTGKILFDRFGSASAARLADRAALVDAGLKPHQIEALLDPALTDRAGDELDRVRALGGSAVPLGAHDYPALLAATYDPPPVLYALGDHRKALEAVPVVAIVGSRRASTYGRNVASRLAADLARREITVLSGLARGIDAVAHAAALDAGGPSVAVMGTGLDAVYPREHERLARRLAENGALVTEFPVATPPASQNFPFRNRIIAGLALGVLVVEAAERSGSLITARLANEQGRDVLAVPGNVTSATSWGPNHLIKDGASPVHGWADVVEQLPAAWRDRILERERSSQTGPAERQGRLAEAIDLTDNERKALKHLSLDNPKHVDELATATRFDAGTLADALFTLESKGLVSETPGGFFVKKF